MASVYPRRTPGATTRRCPAVRNRATGTRTQAPRNRHRHRVGNRGLGTPGHTLLLLPTTGRCRFGHGRAISDARLTVSESAAPDGVVFFDIHHGGNVLAVQWQEHWHFGVSSPGGHGYGEKPDEEVFDSVEAAKQFQRMLLQFIETVIVHQFPSWSRQEIEKMLRVTDVSQTRVFQEALEQGREEGTEKTIETVALRLLKMGRPVAEIAQATDLTSAQIRKLSKKSQK
jgi:hypothetical protein